MNRIPVAKFLCAGLLLSMVNLKAASTEPSSVINFPPSTAQKWILPNGLTIIVQEDRSAPVASVQAWCATGSIYEDQHLGAGLSHILEHMLFKGTKTRSTNEIAQKIQDVGGYIWPGYCFLRPLISGIPIVFRLSARSKSTISSPRSR